jgi:predicted O-methyltransferase YrrM
MNERQVGRWARQRVISHFLAGTISPKRARGNLTAIYRALKTQAASLERASLADVFPGIDQTTVQIKYSPRMGGGTLADLITLAQVVRHRTFDRMVEIGTFRGYTTYHLALNSRPSAHVYTLDLPAAGIPTAALELTDLVFINKPISGEWFRNTDCEPKITQLLGDSASFDYSAYEGRMDFVFVDGGHSYEYAMADSLTARKLLVPGGVIMWHDYPTYPGVWACLDRLSREWPGKLWWIDGTALVVWKAE